MCLNSLQNEWRCLGVIPLLGCRERSPWHPRGCCEVPGDAGRLWEILGDAGKCWEMMPGDAWRTWDEQRCARRCPQPLGRGTGPCLHLQLSPLQRRPSENGAQRAELNRLPGITEASLIPSTHSHIKGFLVLPAEGTQSLSPVSLLRSRPSLCALALRSGSV